jgi:hypothetical protein
MSRAAAIETGKGAVASVFVVNWPMDKSLENVPGIDTPPMGRMAPSYLDNIERAPLAGLLERLALGTETAKRAGPTGGQDAKMNVELHVEPGPVNIYLDSNKIGEATYPVHVRIQQNDPGGPSTGANVFDPYRHQRPSGTDIFGSGF